KPDTEFYRFKGVIQKLIVKRDRNGRPWVEFRLDREKKTRFPCRAFNEKAEAVLADYNEGDEVDIVGKFESFVYEKQGGSQGVINYFHIVRVGQNEVVSQFEFPPQVLI